MIDDDEKPRKRGLGRGLDALFEDEESIYPQPGFAPGDTGAPGTGDSRRMLDIAMVEPNPGQPRRHFDEQALKDLADSIEVHGILQPLLVRPKAGFPGLYQIVAGERRWRAAQIARLHEVPVVIQDLDDGTVLEVALVENLQREDLNALEEAEGYKRLTDQFGHTQEHIAEMVGKSRSHVANMMRLMALPPAVQAMVRDGDLTGGHARALVTAKDPDGLARRAIAEGLSVRQMEALAGEEAGRPKKSGGSAGKKAAPEKDVDTLALEAEVSNALGMKVTIDLKSQGAGVLKIEFASLDQLDEVLHRLSHFPGKRQSG